MRRWNLWRLLHPRGSGIQDWTDQPSRRIGVDVIGDINSNHDLVQFSRIPFTLREGWDVPIKFHSNPAAPLILLPPALTTKTIITAFHLEENPDAESLKGLIEYLDDSPIPLTVIAALPVSGTLLLLHVLAFFQELLGLPRVAFLVTDA